MKKLFTYAAQDMSVPHHPVHSPLVNALLVIISVGSVVEPSVAAPNGGIAQTESAIPFLAANAVGRQGWAKYPSASQEGGVEGGQHTESEVQSSFQLA